LLILFVILSFIATVFCHSQSMRYTQLILALAAIISPLFAALSAIGLMLLAGFHLNVLVIMSPFLTLAIGIG
uniref:SSD domain-containing protein n=1 Tax=Gongylonema pulchrum TaxID=637853 RepID=A0A183DMI8_9BILA